MSGEDAKALIREFAASGEGPRLTDQMYDLIVPASELQNLPDYKLYVRTLLGGQPQEPSLVHAFPPFEKTGDESDAGTVARTSLQRYGRDRRKVEDAVGRFFIERSSLNAQ